MRLKVLLFVCVMLVNALATNPAKPETPRLPWLFSPGIVDELMVHTAGARAQGDSGCIPSIEERRFSISR